MPVAVTCPNPVCGKSATVAESLLGRTARCKACGQSFTLRRTLEPTAIETTAPVPPADQLISLGRFQIRERLGAGAFGTVHRAYDPQLDREVAIKVPHAGAFSNPKRAERFLREAKAAARLHHPSIVPVYDAGLLDGTYYIVTALIEGQPLADAIPAEGMNVRRATRIVSILAAGVGFAHNNGVVHRDIKPANIVLDRDDEPHLTDFGSATRQYTDEKLTHEGAVLGTPAYMAPEQAGGQHGEVQPASDQYSLGAVLYDLLTGRPPFEGPPAVVLYNAIHTEPPPPCSLRSDLPKELETICLKALAKRPSDRYPDCQALADDLTRWLQHEPILARPPGAMQRASRWVRQRPRVAAASALTLACGLAACVVIGLAARRPHDTAPAGGDPLAAQHQVDEERLALERQQVAEVRRLAEENARRAADAEERLRREQDERRRADERQRQDEERRREEDRLAKANGDPKPADPAPAPKPPSPLLQTLYQQGSALCIAFSPDGKLLASGGEDRAVHVWDATAGFREMWVSPKHASGVASVAFNPNSRLVASAESQTRSTAGTLRLWDTATGQLQKDTLRGYLCAAFSPDGKYLAACCTNAQYAQRGVAKGKAISVTVKTDTTQVGRWDNAERFLSLQGTSGQTGRVRCVAFHPMGTALASGGEDRMVRLWYPDQGGYQAFPILHVGAVLSVAFSPDGSQLVSGGGDSAVIVWNVATRKPEWTQRFTASPVTGAVLSATAVTFSPDGRQVAAAGGGLQATSGEVLIWDAKTGNLLVALPAHPAGVNGLAYDRSGDRLVTACSDSHLRVWNVAALLASGQTPAK